MLKVGQLLKEERLKKGLTLEQASSSTKIRASFLEDIEKGDYQNLPSTAYAQGFVRNYARWLGFSEKEILPLFRREFDENKVFRVLPLGLPKQDEFSLKRFKFRQTVFLAALAFLLLLGYVIFQYRFAFIGPPLDVSSPKGGAIVTSSNIVISGKTVSDATVFVNGEQVSVSDDGSFRKEISLFPGKSTIKIRALNRFGKETDIERHIELKSTP